MILLIDNYDSFSYNLVQLAGSLRQDVKVVRNDALTVEEVEALSPERIILSPGPGYPKDAGICEDVVRCLGDHIPILGVCLGHQAICEVYGATISHARCLMHGKQSCIKINTDSLIFRGLPEEVPVARYHSLAAQRDTMPDCLTIIGGDGGDHGRNGHQRSDGRFSGSPTDEGGGGDRDHGLCRGNAGKRPEGGGSL